MDEQARFDKLKEVVAIGLALKQPDFEATHSRVSPFTVDTDVFVYALEGVVSES